MRGLDLSFSALPPGWAEARYAEGYRVLVQNLWTGGYANNAALVARAGPNLRQAREAGMLVAGYVNTGPWFPAATAIAEAKKNAGAEWAHLLVVFNDVEIAGVTEAQVQAHTDALKAEGKTVALYSARWFWNWWALSLGHLPVFAEPLWYALYDGVAVIGDPGFGRWTGVIGKQYQNTTDLAGVQVDLNEFVDARTGGRLAGFFEEDDMALTPQQEADIAAAGELARAFSQTFPMTTQPDGGQTQVRRIDALIWLMAILFHDASNDASADVRRLIKIGTMVRAPRTADGSHAHGEPIE